MYKNESTVNFLLIPTQCFKSSKLIKMREKDSLSEWQLYKGRHHSSKRHGKPLDII